MVLEGMVDTMPHLGAGLSVLVCFWGPLRSTPSSQVRPLSFSFEMIYRSLRTELLVDVVDVVLEGSGIDEKFLGITLFALVPNTTEFMNAISFALNGNIALR
jgi:Ca2+/H+ antiporter